MPLRLLLIGIMTASALGGETQVKLSPTRYFLNYEVGQIEQGISDVSGQVDREMISHASVWMLQQAEISGDMRLSLGLGGVYFIVFPRNLGANPYVHSKRSGLGLADAHGEFDFWKREGGNHGLRLNVGIFPYKYNEDAKDLGEYLFRTWTYPTIVTTGGFELINSAAAQLSGVSGNTRLGPFSNDLLLTIQQDRPPVFGLSLTDIVSYRFGSALTLGAGFMFDNFYAPNELGVQPKSVAKNRYYVLNDGRKMADPMFTGLKEQGLATDSAIVDTGYYTLAGQKAMVRASLDLGSLFSQDRMPDGDFRLYTEICLMGVKDYPTYYEKKMDRTAFLFGANMPTFGFLDRLSVEAEYLRNPFRNSTTGTLSEGTATPPVTQFGDPKSVDVKDDDWKWCLYAKKSVHSSLAFHAQAASDHLRMLDVFSVPDGDDFLRKRNHWYWALKMTYSI